jgi:hypothetical protein
MESEKIMKVGQELADNYGAKCLGYELKETTLKGLSVVFICKEFDEIFTTTISLEELNQRIDGTYKEPSFEDLKQQAISLSTKR